MKFSKKEFKEFVISEAMKVAQEEGFIFESVDTKGKDILEEHCGCEPAQDDFLSNDGYEEVKPEEFMEEAVEAKTLSEELKRMKQLLDFNNPLLKK